MIPYRSLVVDQSLELFGGLLDATSRTGLVRDHLRLMADRLYLGMRQGHPYVPCTLTNHHPEFLGKEAAALPDPERLGLEDAQRCIAAEYGFRGWASVLDTHAAYDPEFEASADALIQGEAGVLETLLKQRPQLAQNRSPYGHGATLLHYCASNGVEIWRQQVPASIPELAAILLNYGADPKATMQVYDGDFTAFELAGTSAHPKAAGVYKALLKRLKV